MIATAIHLFYLGVTRAPDFNGPPWVAYVVGVIFLAAGVQLVVTAWGRAGHGLWVGFIFFAGIASVFWWISLGSDPRGCTASIGPFNLGSRVCQVGFGFGALFSTASAIYLARLLFFPRGPRSYY